MEKRNVSNILIIAGHIDAVYCYRKKSQQAFISGLLVKEQQSNCKVPGSSLIHSIQSVLESRSDPNIP